MKQIRQRMADILRELHEIQLWAMEHSIHSFKVSARVYPLEDEGDGEEGLIRDYGDTEERFVDVVIFKTGNDSDEDYLSTKFTQDDTSIEIYRKINEIEAFIGYV